MGQFAQRRPAPVRAAGRRAPWRFDHWKPDAGLFVNDLWPNLILARHSWRKALGPPARSAARWSGQESVVTLLSAFDTCWQDEEGAERCKLGARKVEVVGSLKADAPPLAVDEEALMAMRRASAPAGVAPGLIPAKRPCRRMIAARTISRPLTILVPRHTERSADLKCCAVRAPPRRRAAGGVDQRETAIYIADTMADGAVHRLSPFCFLGDTLVPLGGHNVLGPYYAVLAAHGQRASCVSGVFDAQQFGLVHSSGGVAREAARLLGNPAMAAAAGDAAARGAASLSARGDTAAALKTLLDARADFWQSAACHRCWRRQVRCMAPASRSRRNADPTRSHLPSSPSATSRRAAATRRPSPSPSRKSCTPEGTGLISSPAAMAATPATPRRWPRAAIGLAMGDEACCWRAPR